MNYVSLQISSNGSYFGHQCPNNGTVGPTTTAWNTVRCAIQDIEKLLIQHIRTSAQHETDPGCYTGNMGIVLAMYFANHSEWQTIASHIPHFSSKRVTFLEGSMFQAVLQHQGRPNDTLFHIAERACQMPSNECELLYGRAGCLQGLLFYTQRFEGNANDGQRLNEMIVRLATQIINEGKNDDNLLLMWQWHNSHYLGAIHGVAGILFILLTLPQEVLLQIDPLFLDRVVYTVDHILTNYRYSSGNIQSSIKYNRVVTDRDDRLVQFCHGATGWIPLLCQLSRLFPSDREKYLEQARQMSEVVWERGLIANKGPGICHGIGGSICALMDMHTASGETLWLQRAQWFSVVLANKWGELTHHADRPYSLFEGCAGAYYSLSIVNELTNTGVDTTRVENRPNSWFPGLRII